jgi:hypothetical protein
MNTVSSETNTHILRGRRPKVNSTSAPFKTGRVSHDAICWKHGRMSSLSGSPAAISYLEIATDAPVSMATRHGLAAIWASACGMLSPFLVDTRVCNEGAGAMAPASSWRRPPLLFLGSRSTSFEEVLLGMSLSTVSAEMAYAHTLPACGSTNAAELPLATMVPPALKPLLSTALLATSLLLSQL